MWSVRRDEFPGARGLRFSVELEQRPATWENVLSAWTDDREFRSVFNGCLADSPYAAFRRETPAVTSMNLTEPFEFVLLDSPGLARRPDRQSFAERFTDAEVVVFSNLSADAVLVVPRPVSEESAYGHLAAFVRLVPEAQRNALSTAAAHRVSRRRG